MSSRSVPSDFAAELRQGLSACGFGNGRLLVAVSGGADSVALLRGLAHLRAPDELDLIVGHVDHGLRGAASSADAEWVCDLSSMLEVRCEVLLANVADRILESGESVEEAARRLRYEELTRLAVSEQCQAIAVAHTADDQAETVLHHLIRGTGLVGLRGIPRTRLLRENPEPRGAGALDSGSVGLIRPLLDVPRQRLVQWLAEMGQEFRTDESNTDQTFTRNRIRHTLLPLLEEEFNPQIRRVLASLSCQAGEAGALIRDHAEAIARDAVLHAGDEAIRIDRGSLRNHPPVLIRETLRILWQNAGWPMQKMGFSEWSRLAEVVVSGGVESLPGRVDARRRGEMLVLTRER